MASTPACGFAFPANEFVDLAITYKDSFHTPLAGKNLVWQLLEGEATLRHQSTPVGSDGNGVNSIQVELADPTANTTIRLAVWPEDEPDSKLEFECLFGAPKAAPPISAGNVLQIIYPPDDKNGQAPVSLDTNWNSVRLVGLYATGSGEKLPKDSIELDLRREFQSEVFLLGSDVYGVYSADPMLVDISDNMYDVILQADGVSSSTNCYFSQNVKPDDRIINFWPPAGSVLQPGYSYPLRAIFVDESGSGRVGAGSHISWSMVDASPDTQTQIAPEESELNASKIAVATITCTHAPFGTEGTFKLKVGLQDAEEGGGLKFDYPAFKVGGPRFCFVDPQPDGTVHEAATTCQFEVSVRDENGSIPSGKFDIAWEASMQGEEAGKAYFQPSKTSLYEGSSFNAVAFDQVPPGKVQNFDVTITPSVGAPYKATYQVAANSVTQISPVGDDPLPIRTAMTVEVSLKDYNGKPLESRKLIVAPNNEITISDFYPVTNGEGIATIQVSSFYPLTTSLSISEALNCVPTTINLTFAETKRNIVTINKPEVDIRYDTQVALTAGYTTPQGTPIESAQLKLDFSLPDGSPLPPNLTWMRSSTTGSTGQCSFWFNYSTTDGVPTSPLSIIATAHDDSGASNSTTLKFIGGGRDNHLTLLHPANNSSQEPGTDIHVKLQLTNNHRQPMAKYPITWLVPEGVTVKSSDSLTAANGEATAVFTTTAKRMFEFDVVATAANASRHFRLNFTGNDYYDSSMFCNTNYAHNMPEGLDAVPRDESEIVVFNFIYKKNGVPQPDQWIDWNVEPMTGNLRFYDENNFNWEADSDHNVRTKTDGEGRAIVKIGSSAAHLGHVTAKPVNNLSAITSPVEFVIATFSPDLAEPHMGYVTYEPNPIQLSSQYSIDHTGFTLSIPENSAQPGFDLVVFWLENHMSDPVPSERILITDIREAEDGVIVPFNYVTPTVGTTNTNMFCYMVVDSRTGQGFRSIPIPPAVKGTPLTNMPMPDQDRPMLAPRLYDNATIVGHGDIINGLNVIVDYDPKYWIPGEAIHLIVYLNKRDGSFGANLTQELEITDVEITAKKMVFNFPYDQVNGYDHGTLEADYFIGHTWSAVLDKVVFNTVDPFA